MTQKNQKDEFKDVTATKDDKFERISGRVQGDAPNTGDKKAMKSTGGK